MKARCITRIERGQVNPDYKPEEHALARQYGNKYETPVYLPKEVGDIVEGPLVWSLCCPGHENEAPCFEPDDDECRAKVDHFMEVDRPKGLESIRLAAQPENLKKMSKKGRQDVERLVDVYDIDPAGPPLDKPKANKKGN